MDKGEVPGDFGERMPHGFVQEDGNQYRVGALYARFGQTKIGIDSDRHVRHAIQDMFAHHFAKSQPGFRSLSKDIKPYWQSSASFSIGNKKGIKFTLYD